MKRKVLCVTLVLLLLASLFAGCKTGGSDGGSKNTGGKGMELAAAPLGGDDAQAAAPGINEVQDIVAFAGGRLGTADLSESGGNYVRSISGNASDYEVYAAYIEYLKQNGFTVAGDYEFSYEKSFYGTTLNDTRSAIDTKIELTFDSSKEPGNIYCYCQIERNSLTGQVWYAHEYTVRDFGARFGGSNADMSYAGLSAKAGLYSDGENFETTDGRLKTKLGEATVIYGGSTYTVPTDVHRTTDLEVLNFFVRDYDRADSMGFRYRENYLKQGDLLTAQELKAGNEFQGWVTNDVHTINGISMFSWQTALLFCHNDRYTVVTEDKSGGITKAFVRALIYEKGKLAVFYIAAEFDSAPETVEMLCAFDITAATEGSSKQSIDDARAGGGNGSGENGTTEKMAGTICSYCDGDGKVTCGTCNGSGTIERYAAGGGTITSGCPDCSGQKEVTCPFCHGKGTL